MTDETPTYFRHVFIQIGKGVLKVQLVKEIFIRIARRAMRREPTAAKYRGAWQATQILFPCPGELRTWPRHGGLGVFTKIVVEAEVAGGLIMIARNDAVRPLPRPLRPFMRLGVVPDNI